MKIAIAQTQPVKGDIAANIELHLKLIAMAVSKGADCILFPELSLTGYEPSLAQRLAIDLEDERLSVFQKQSDQNQIIIGIGAPTVASPLPKISMMVFEPNGSRWCYAKQYLHPDEMPYFSAGIARGIIEIDKVKLALAICYELSIEAHVFDAKENLATMYIASSAKTADGVVIASERMRHIAKTHNMVTVLINSVGETDDFICGGKSAIWSAQGLSLCELSADQEELLVFDTASMQAI